MSRGTLGLFGGPQRMDSELTPSAVGAREVTGTFELREAGRLEVTVVDVGGQVSKDKLTVPIVLPAGSRGATNGTWSTSSSTAGA